MELAQQNPGREITGQSDGGDNPSESKCSNTTRFDRLSELPDLTLVHVLSQLYTEEAARTSVLSKRFKSLWNSVDSLRFSDTNCAKSDILFVTFVDAVLKLHRRKVIDNFSLEFRFKFEFKDFVDEWLRFATQKQVKSLHLNFTSQVPNQVVGSTYELPIFLYDSLTLVELVTSCCHFSIEGKINWSALKILSMTQIKINEELISRILSGCNVLERLELKEWSGFDKLKVISSNLKVLRIVGEQRPKYTVHPGQDLSLEISGPHLLSLEVSGLLYRTRVQLTDIGSLVNAVMDFKIRPQKNSLVSVRIQDNVKEILESLCLVKALTVGGWLIKALGTLEAFYVSSPWSERRSLTLSVPVVEWTCLGIASLLHSSPFLETLVIKLRYCSDMCFIAHCNDPRIDKYEESYWKSWLTISKCPLRHLRTVKVTGFQVSCRSIEPIFQFLEFLLANAKFLEEIVIQSSRHVTRAALNEAMKLIAAPTASPDSTILFEPPHFWVDPLCKYHKTDPF